MKLQLYRCEGSSHPDGPWPGVLGSGCWHGLAGIGTHGLSGWKHSEAAARTSANSCGSLAALSVSLNLTPWLPATTWPGSQTLSYGGCWTAPRPLGPRPGLCLGWQPASTGAGTQVRPSLPSDRLCSRWVLASRIQESQQHPGVGLTSWQPALKPRGSAREGSDSAPDSLASPIHVCKHSSSVTPAWNRILAAIRATPLA